MKKEGLAARERGAFSLSEAAAVLLFVFVCAAMTIRVFFGTELTDEAFYLADTLGMIHGNLPYALNDFFLGTGFSFLPLPLLFVYERLVPGCEGIVLYSRLCFVGFQILCATAAVLILRRHMKPAGAVLFGACMIPCFSAGIPNFSYNTIPLTLLCLGAVIVCDAVESRREHAGAALFFCGFLSAVSVFAHPAYACAVLLYLVLIPLRSEKKKRVSNLLCYMAGGIAEILIVLIPLAAQTGLGALWDGFEPLVTSKFPREPMASRSLGMRILDLGWVGFLETVVFAAAALLLLLRGRKGEKGKRAFPFMLWLAAGLALLLAIALLRGGGYDRVCELGVAGAMCAVLLLLFGGSGRTPLLLYLGVYPVCFALLQLFFSDQNAAVSRFDACLPVLFCVLLVLARSEDKLTETLALCCMAACVLLQGFSAYKEPYRDEAVWKLDARVESGVYRGLWTTEQRAAELPRMEAYLNALIGEEEYYAFRDCAPFAYLMMHHGKICDVSSWDLLQYSYGRNTPSRLLDYYRRRGAVPDVIVYIDFGRDARLSAEDESVRYNDFLNACYSLESGEYRGELFRKVLVFRCRGFDGDIERRIEDYNTIPESGELILPAEEETAAAG